MKMVLVPADLLTATVRYLATRPYVEVVSLIQPLTACKEAPDETAETELE